jgi:hypothetical protein
VRYGELTAARAELLYAAAAAHGFDGAKIAADRLTKAETQLRWEDVTTSSKHDVVAIDARSIRRVQYPDIKQPISYNLLRYKMVSYTEVWAKATDEAGDPSWQSLFLFDCKGRMANHANSDFKANTSFDATSRAEQIGTEVFMRRIGPDAVGEAVDRRVCRKR